MDPAACDPSEELRDDIIFFVENLLSLWLEHPPEELRRALETRLQRLFSGLLWLFGSLSPTIQAFLQHTPHLLSATPASLPDSPDVILPGPSEPSAGRKCRSRRRRATPQPDIRTFNSAAVVSEDSFSDCVTVHSGAVFCAADDCENSSSPAQQPLSAQFSGVTPPLLSEFRPYSRSKQWRKKDYVVEDTGLTPLQSFALFLGLPSSELHKLPTSSSQPHSTTPLQPPVAAQPPVAQLAAPQPLSAQLAALQPLSAQLAAPQSPVLLASPSVQSPVLLASPSVQSPVLPASPSVQSPVLRVYILCIQLVLGHRFYPHIALQKFREKHLQQQDFHPQEMEKGNVGWRPVKTEKVPEASFLAVGRILVPATTSSLDI